MIKISGLKKVYTTGAGQVTALENVNLEIAKGDIYGIIGLSGAGKSTLIRCLNLLEKPTAGSIRIDGNEITDLRGAELRQLRSSLGMIFQHFNLLMQRNVEENVAFPLEVARVPKNEIRARVHELLELVGLSDKTKAYPAQLSGGQKQRVAIARALANNPKVLLCDEATSALDQLTTSSILRLLKDINQKLGLTIVLITHEMGVVKEICNKVAVIDSNHIVEHGATINVLAAPKTEAAKKLFGHAGGAVPPDIVFPAHGHDYSVRVRIVFTGRTALEPVVSTIVRRYQIDANILFGKIEYIHKAPLGELALELSGSEAAVKKALRHIEQLDLHYEVLS